ncbi:carboxylesterase/lipase family protein [Aspergillus mulundensis]|uniref:Carboxylic ester hydrolase n=1 Tax=Aspergillus mulundensis TaxID=1810919 RepID=A0A3D8Q8T7_9EURO|nr:Carboxylic ester hydrolase [Aspergillus mulundensis]RDW57854.1 Carboxylic ester hydrolase [Aspergillus mulundensis]
MKLLFFLASGSALVAATSFPVIETNYGPVKGAASPYRDGVTVYKGIPFAAAPTGSKRWTAPTAPDSWTDVLHATKFGPQCAQPYSEAGIFSSGKNSTSEDCLYLNIWTPTYNTTDTNAIQSMNLPIYFWIFGGRFEGGSGDVKTYDGTGLASKDIIVVTINYRLGAFGFLAHPELSQESGHNSSGNYGILDQQFALRWVQDNIAAFGGNASQVTVGGQSAGSASALDMMWSPLSAGLVAGVISESGARGPHDPATGGVATSYNTKDEAESFGVTFLATMNVSSIAELRQAPMADLIAQGQLTESDYYTGTPFESLYSGPPRWRPNIDGYVFPHGYGKSLSLKAHADVPILTGNNKNENDLQNGPSTVSEYKAFWTEVFQNYSSEFFSLYPATTASEASDLSNQLLLDIARVGTWEWAAEWAAGGAKSNVYTYFFTKAPAEDESMGVYHGAELWYTFNNIPYSDYSEVTWNTTDYEIEATVSDYWANFIRGGDPNGDGLAYFPPSSAANMTTMWLGEWCGAGPIAHSQARIAFLRRWMAQLHEY